MTVPSVTPFTSQLPDENDPTTFSARASVTFDWLTTIAPEINALGVYIENALNGSETVLSAVATIQSTWGSFEPSQFVRSDGLVNAVGPIVSDQGMRVGATGQSGTTGVLFWDVVDDRWRSLHWRNEAGLRVEDASGTFRTVWHTGNHGPNSGLNADMVDGLHGGELLNASNLNAGTVPNARLPQSLWNASSLTSGIVPIERLPQHITDIRLGPAVRQNAAPTLFTKIWNTVPEGSVITNIQTFNVDDDNTYVTGIEHRPLQILINGTWVTVSVVN